MLKDKISYGETYDLSVSVCDSDGNAVTLDETYSAKYRFTDSRELGGTEIAAGDMVIADGVATASIDTGNTPWTAGIYFYDVRITDEEENEYVSEVIQLVISATQTLPA